MRIPATDPRAAKYLAMRSGGNKPGLLAERVVKSLPVASSDPLPCRHEGAVLEFCPTCNRTKGEGRHVRDCDLYGTCTRAFVSDRTRSCDRCPDYAHELVPWAGEVLTLNERNFFPDLPGKRFNPALAEWDGGYVFCWRDGWKGSNLWAVRLDAGLQPVARPVRLEMGPHPECSYGREDPTLFTYRGSLHVSFVGVEGRGRQVTRTNMLYARLGADLRVEQSWTIRRPPGVPSHRWEKNWQFVPSGDRLFAVYLVTPRLQVVEVLPGGATRYVVDEPHELPWSGGEVRGGATPVLRGGEYYSFFHDRIEVGGVRVYRAGCYTFDADTFRAVRITRDPLIVADPKTNPGNYCHCVFPRGAVLRGDSWVLSCGVHDRFTEIRRIPAAAVEAALEPI